MNIYYDRQGNPISRHEAEKLLRNVSALRVARDEVGECCVSTVHLVVNHRFGSGPPLIFETKVFGPFGDEEVSRYSTEAKALAGHEAKVLALRALTRGSS